MQYIRLKDTWSCQINKEQNVLKNKSVNNECTKDIDLFFIAPYILLLGGNYKSMPTILFASSARL